MPVSRLFSWTELIATKFSTGIHGPQTINPSGSGDLLTFVVVPEGSFKSDSPVLNAGRSFALLLRSSLSYTFSNGVL